MRDFDVRNARNQGLTTFFAMGRARGATSAGCDKPQLQVEPKLVGEVCSRSAESLALARRLAFPAFLFSDCQQEFLCRTSTRKYSILSSSNTLGYYGLRRMQSPFSSRKQSIHSRNCGIRGTEFAIAITTPRFQRALQATEA